MQRRDVLVLVPSVVAGLPATARGQAASVLAGTAPGVSHADVRKLIAILTFTEAALMVAAQVNSKPSAKGEAKWHATYDESTWQIDVGGGVESTSVSTRLVGVMWGNERENVLSTYAGNGQIGKEPMLIHGKVDWPYDTARKDYFTTDFWHLTKVGANSTWDWTVAAEIIVGGLGGGAAISNPVGLLAFLAVGTAALAGAELLKSVSKSYTPPSSEALAAPPPLPPRPTQAASQPSSQRQDDEIVIECTKEGALTIKVKGNGPGRAANIEGRCHNGRGSGTINWRGN